MPFSLAETYVQPHHMLSLPHRTLVERSDDVCRFAESPFQVTIVLLACVARAASLVTAMHFERRCSIADEGFRMGKACHRANLQCHDDGQELANARQTLAMASAE